MPDMYTDIERSIQQSLQAAVASILPTTVAIFNNQVTKADYPDQHCAISIMKISDVFQPANGGGTKSLIRTPVLVNNAVDHFEDQDWPDPFDLVYALTVTAENVKSATGSRTAGGLTAVRAVDAMIRQVFKPRRCMLIWDSTLNNGDGGWSSNYVNYAWAGYINRDVPDEEIYNRVTNIRFEVFNYDPTLTEVPAIKQTDLTVGLPTQS